jgi:hypothetical protein
MTRKEEIVKMLESKNIKWKKASDL